MENIFAKPPPSIPQHYKMLLQKKEASLSSTTDCFAPVSLSPNHLYTPNGILLGQRRNSSKVSAYTSRALSEIEPLRSVYLSDNTDDLKKELQQSKQENKKLEERIDELEQLLKAHNIDYINI